MQFVSQFIIHSRLFAASHSRGTKPPCWRQKSRWDWMPFVCLVSVRLCSPAGRFCTTWITSCKGPIFLGVKHQVDGKFKKLSVYPQHRRKKHLAMSVPRIIGYTTEGVKQNYKNQSKSIEECTDCTHFSRIPTQCVSPVKTLGIHIAWKSGFGANYFSHDGLIVVHFFSIKYFEWVIFKQAANPIGSISAVSRVRSCAGSFSRTAAGNRAYKSHFWSFLEIQRRLDVHGGGYVFYQNIEMHYGVLGFRENMADDVQVFDGSWSRKTVYCLKTAKSYPLAFRESRGKKFLFFSCSNFSSNWPLPLFKTDLFWKF